MFLLLDFRQILFRNVIFIFLHIKNGHILKKINKTLISVQPLITDYVIV